jgi:hypothetical protein
MRSYFYFSISHYSSLSTFRNWSVRKVAYFVNPSSFSKNVSYLYIDSATFRRGRRSATARELTVHYAARSTREETHSLAAGSIQEGTRTLAVGSIRVDSFSK